jgi:acetyl-CoA C-acetyltransferase
MGEGNNAAERASWIVAGCRTPLGRFLGELSGLTAVELAAASIRESIARSGVDPASVNQSIIGQVISAGAGQAPARQASIAAGLPPSVGATTINKVCGSGLYAVMLADMAIRAGDAQCVVAGGMESMSNGPHLLRGGRAGWKYGRNELIDSVEIDGLYCTMGATGMGAYADQTAAKKGISREDQDEWAITSHQRALAATQSGAFTDEIIPVDVPSRRETVTISADQGPRADSTIDSLSKLRPAFAADGTVTAANASPLSDGAASVIVTDESTAKQATRLASFRIVAHANHGEAPEDIFIAPVGAIQKVLQKANRSVADIDLFELNEAFAAQVLACQRELKIDSDKLNIHGGAIALGHPLGCSGTRVLVTLMNALIRHDKQSGIAALCLGGGESVAMLIERG